AFRCRGPGCCGGSKPPPLPADRAWAGPSPCSALKALAGLGAVEAVVCVDDDAPRGDPRDRPAVLWLCRSAGFMELGQVCSCVRPAV
ncbi:MAG: hypothetical protein ACRDQB_02320, partial [Thermocrispum sp.]